MKVIRPSEMRPQRPESNKFTDGVWQEEIQEAQIADGARAHRFSYDPGAHSHWHRHDGEQTLLAVSGVGYVNPRHGDLVKVSPGDIVYVSPGEEHWHGAGPDGLFVHFAFTASGGTSWLEQVAQEEYLGFVGATPPRSISGSETSHERSPARGE